MYKTICEIKETADIVLADIENWNNWRKQKYEKQCTTKPKGVSFHFYAFWYLVSKDICVLKMESCGISRLLYIILSTTWM